MIQKQTKAKPLGHIEALRTTAWSSQSIKIGKSDLIDIDYIDQSVEIDDTLVSFIDLPK